MPKIDMFEKFGVHKCLGCKHYLSGDGFGCEKNCPRTEDGVEQVQCRIKNINTELRRLEKEIFKLKQQRNELHKIVWLKEFKN